MFTDQIMETEDFDPNMPTIERYTTGSFWNQVICSFQFPPTKCFHRIDNRFCATLQFLTAAKLSIEHYPHLKNWVSLNIEKKITTNRVQYSSIASVSVVTH